MATVTCGRVTFAAALSARPSATARAHRGSAIAARPSLRPVHGARRFEKAPHPSTKSYSATPGSGDAEPSKKAAPVAAAPQPTPGIPVEDVKAALLDSLFGTERGLTASAETRAEINELLAQLEAQNPTPCPNEAMELLDGEWKLVYTSNSELMALLAANNLPLVTIGDITQSIDGATQTVVNKVQVTVPFSSTTVAAQAKVEVRSPKRLQVKFQQGTISTPTITENLDIPASANILGQTVDLRPLEEAFKPLERNLAGVASQLQNLLSQSPDLSFPIESENAQTWLITTYLDQDTRVSRGDMGSVFILVKDVSLS
eukprot:CAMPEP_0117650874 /NCGR_PEP_ID=MMETSP0804-20121206/1777_1 /TAXON_ID=1074897 /ORGANISM="Tetraselmis astigmatica, Strain CCMP880" /LENGTH=315 /DNA_ID=CAMNT_0005456785 /DNA_START=70 /DNA_END=1017 /DNA_ORIENTATION=-